MLKVRQFWAKTNRKVIFESGGILVMVIVAVLLQFELSSVSRQTHSQIALGDKLRLKLQTVNKTLFAVQSEGVCDRDLVVAVTRQIKNIKSRINSLQTDLKSIQDIEGESLQMEEELPLEQRIKRLEVITKNQDTILSTLENHYKEALREKRTQKFKSMMKKDYFDSDQKKHFWMMETANMRTPYMTQSQLNQLENNFKKQEKRLDKMYNLSAIQTQLPFCIVVPTYNNVRDFRYAFNLQSILNQNYTNYHVVIIDDASPDGTGKFITKMLKEKNIGEDKVKLLINQKQMTAVPTIHKAITGYCDSDQIAFFVDGDDQLISRQAFRIFNAIYQQKQPAIAYSKAFEYWYKDNTIKDGWSQAYTQEQKNKNLYRDVAQKISHLRSFRVDLYLKIKEKDLKDSLGKWFTSTYDEVICLPMLEMSCGNIEFIEEYLYLYLYGTGFNDRAVDPVLQHSIAQYVRKEMPKYQCNTNFAKKTK